MLERPLHGVEGRRQRHLPAKRVVAMPGKIVVGARGIADPPMCHGALRIMRESLLEAFDGLAMIEAEHPVEASVEPELRVRRRRSDLPAVRSKIKVGHGSIPQSSLHLRLA